MTLDGFSTATEMLRALKSKRISSVELLGLHLDRIARFNPTLNAIVTPDFEAARRTAAEADETRMRGEERDLLGLPLTIKDCINVQGLPGTAGAPQCAERYPQSDAPVIERIRDAGGIIMGKTNVAPWAGDWQSDNPLFGRTNNPWDLNRTPGGSTGGGAAALAAGMTPLEFGSDSGGSIRVPAAFCGVYGHVPSETAVPRSGHFPGMPLPNAATAMAVQGPMARCAEDLDLALGIIAGPEAGEDVSWHLRLPPPRHDRLCDYRAAFLPPIDWLPVDAEIMAAMDALAGDLESLGCRIRVAQPDAFGDLRDHYRLNLSLSAAISTVGQPESMRHEEAEKARESGTEFGDAWARGLEASASDYLLWFSWREIYRRSYRAFFEEWDVLVAPVALVPAFPHTDAPESERTLTINGKEIDYRLQLVYPGLANLSGQPATAFPIGFTRSGLPIGIQAIGPYLEDRTSIRFSGLVARERGGFRPPPEYGDGGCIGT